MKGIPLNLASRPFERTVRARRVAALVGAVVLAVSLAHGALVGYLWTAVRPAPGGPAAAGVDGERIDAWRRQVDRLAEAGRADRARRVATAVALANEMIDWRTFPWSRLFRELEETLPDDVRLELVQPGAGSAGASVELIAAGRDGAALRLFLEGLLEHPNFEEVFPLNQTSGDDGLQRLAVQARYVPAEEAG